MSRPPFFWTQLASSKRRLYLLAGIGLLFLAVGVAFWSWPSPRTSILTITDSTTAGTRDHILNFLAKGAATEGVSLKTARTVGTLEALAKVEAGTIDLALVQGTVRLPNHPNLRHVATLYSEPLHLLVKREHHERVAKDIKELSGMSINTGPRETGSNLIATHVLSFAGIKPRSAEFKEGYVPTRMSHADILRELNQLEKLTGPGRLEARTYLPDAFCIVATIPSTVVKRLVRVGDYRLVALPFSKALTLIDIEEEVEDTDRIDQTHLQTIFIPECTYGVSPAVPDQSCQTLGIPLALVAHKDVPNDAVTRFLTLIYSPPVQNTYEIPKLSEVSPVYPFHSATILYRDRDKPILRSEIIEIVGRLAAVCGSLLGGLLALYGYYRWRRLQIFQSHFETLMNIENVLNGTVVDKQAPKRMEERAQYLHQKLDQLQHGAIQDYCNNRFYGDGVLDNLLKAISDVRASLRDRLADHGDSPRRS